MIRSCGNRWNVRAISSSHEYWTVESMRSRYSTTAAARASGSSDGRNGLGGHPGRVGQLGIVVITQDLLEMARGRPVRVDVRVRVEDRPARHLVEELAGSGLAAAAGVGHDRSSR